jgi:protein tyrosine phosphatase
MKKRNEGKPVLVHCSAGIGRTGTLIALLCMIEAVQAQIELGEEPLISVFGTVRRLREQRWMMVKKQ